MTWRPPAKQPLHDGSVENQFQTQDALHLFPQAGGRLLGTAIRTDHVQDGDLGDASGLTVLAGKETEHHRQPRVSFQQLPPSGQALHKSFLPLGTSRRAGRKDWAQLRAAGAAPDLDATVRLSWPIRLNPPSLAP